MAKVTVRLEFENIAEAAQFFAPFQGESAGQVSAGGTALDPFSTETIEDAADAPFEVEAGDLDDEAGDSDDTKKSAGVVEPQTDPGGEAEAQSEPRDPADASRPARRRSPSISEPTPVTKAARALLETLSDLHVKDEDVAKALGVSRAQVINYRTGKTLFSPRREQQERLEALVERRKTDAEAKLAAAVANLKNAIEIQDLE